MPAGVPWALGPDGELIPRAPGAEPPRAKKDFTSKRFHVVPARPVRDVNEAY